MSEKLYALLFRLYPSRFRDAYAEEAMQLFRDRSRDEHGFFATVRFWFDLLLDLSTSLPREYRNLLRSPVAAPLRQRLTPAPFFDVLEVGSPRPSAFVVAGICSLMVTAAMWAMINHDASRQPWSSVARHHTTPIKTQSSPPPAATAQNTDGSNAHAGLVAAPLPPLPQPAPQTSVSASPPRSNDGATLDAAEKQHVIQQAAADLQQYYFDRNVARVTADALLAHEKNGDDDAATGGAAFAELLSAQMRDDSHDMHLVVEYSQNPLPSAPPVQTAASQERYRQAMLQQNCMFRQVELLPNRIGYLKLDFFPDTSVCGATAKAAMAKLNGADAIIFDLRDNTGGFPDMVSLLASYLFDHPVYMYSPRGAPTADSWTHSPVPGNKLADKPVYVLTSRTTWSGAEQFSYDLKMLKRATLVGETTRGGAHAGVFHRIDDHFGMGIPEQKPINPYGKSDWEGVGVAPNVKVNPADALTTATKLAEAKLQTK
ncbi:MAG: S41 family peptidase [Acidobacteriaceae bacterium]